MSAPKHLHRPPLKCSLQKGLKDMRTHNAENERIKHRYRGFLADAKGASEATIAGVMAALARFEASTGHRPFRSFHIEQARAFKGRLLEAKAEATGASLSLSTVHHICKALEAFFFWLAGEPGFRSRLKHADAAYFSLRGNQVRAARAPGPTRPVPTLAQIDRVLELMPTETDIQRRDRAVIAAAILTGARDGALRTAQLRHVDLAEGLFLNDGRTMSTKGGKVFPTWFFPVGEQALAIVTDWIAHLRNVLLFAETDPLFPATLVAPNAGSQLFEAAGLRRDFWSSAEPIRAIFRRAFEAAGLPYANPHSFRKTLAELGKQLYRNDVEGLQAWAQNLGHESLLTTLTSYGQVPAQRQATIIREAHAAPTPEATGTVLSDAIVERALAQVMAQRRSSAAG